MHEREQKRLAKQAKEEREANIAMKSTMRSTMRSQTGAAKVGKPPRTGSAVPAGKATQNTGGGIYAEYAEYAELTEVDVQHTLEKDLDEEHEIQLDEETQKTKAEEEKKQRLQKKEEDQVIRRMLNYYFLGPPVEDEKKQAGKKGQQAVESPLK